MPLARLIVCETTSKWAVALRRELSLTTDPRVYETRSLEACWQQAVAYPASLVALEATAANLEPLVGSLQQYRLKLPRVRLVVLGNRQFVDSQWLLREAGAIHVMFSSRAMEPLIRMIRRRWGAVSTVNASAGLPGWMRLPWEGDWVTHVAPRPAWLYDEID